MRRRYSIRFDSTRRPHKRRPPRVAGGRRQRRCGGADQFGETGYSAGIHIGAGHLPFICRTCRPSKDAKARIRSVDVHVWDQSAENRNLRTAPVHR